MAWSKVQSAQSENDASGATITVAFPANITTNNLLLVWVTGSHVITSGDLVTDSAGNTYIAATTRVQNANTYTLQLFYALVTAGGGTATTVSVTFDTSETFRGVVIAVFT